MLYSKDEVGDSLDSTLILPGSRGRHQDHASPPITLTSACVLHSVLTMHWRMATERNVGCGSLGLLHRFWDNSGQQQP